MNKFCIYAFTVATVISSGAIADEQRRPPALNPQQQWQQPAPIAPAPVPAPAPAPMAAPQLAAPAPQAAPAAVTPPNVEGRTPLVIIRFNKPDVNYQDQLYTAVSEAVKVSPNVMFDVVGGSRSGEVVSTLNKIGVPHSRISTQTKASGTSYDEVKVYVR